MEDVFNSVLEVYEGTPRSAKTTTLIMRYVRFLMETEDEQHLIVAHTSEMAYRLFLDGAGFGLEHMLSEVSEMKHDVNLGAYLEVHTPKGIRKVYFKGGGKGNSFKTIQGLTLGSVVFLEFNLIHETMIEECFRRTYSSINRHHFADMNPTTPTHYVYGIMERMNAKVIHFNMFDNPIMTEERIQEIYDSLKGNQYLLDKDFFGKRVTNSKAIYSMFNSKEHVKNILLGDIYEVFFTGDGGQGDATSVSCNVVTRYKGKFKLNRIANYYHSADETNEVYAMSEYSIKINEFIDRCVEYLQYNYTHIFIDPACKSLREEMRAKGTETLKADNNRRDAKGGEGSGIEVGIERTQNVITNKQFNLIEIDELHEDYGHYSFIKEIEGYSRDKNGKPIDKNNHALDELRYAVNYFYNHYIK